MKKTQRMKKKKSKKFLRSFLDRAVCVCECVSVSVIKRRMVRSRLTPMLGLRWQLTTQCSFVRWLVASFGRSVGRWFVAWFCCQLDLAT